MNMSKKILVVSHERAGTHFLINSLACNFGVEFMPRNIPVLSQNAQASAGGPEDYQKLTALFLEGLASEAYSPTKEVVFKSHHDIFYYESIPQEFLEENFIIFYIHREVKDTMNSLWYYFRSNHHQGDFVPTEDPEEFPFYEKPSKHVFDRDYSYLEANNLVERWKYHHEGWMDSSLPSLKISYEELHSDFNGSLDQVAGVLNLDKTSWHRPGLREFVSHSPWRGAIGDWVNLFSEETGGKIDAIVNDENISRYNII